MYKNKFFLTKIDLLEYIEKQKKDTFRYFH